MGEHECHDTKQRILNAAGQSFAAKGFRGATVRDICSAAGVNVALVKYHFGDKGGLYREVIDHLWRETTRVAVPVLEAAAHKGPEERLRAYIYAQLLRVKSPDRPAWYDQIMAREMVAPSGVVGVLVDRRIRPMADYLLACVQELLGRSDRAPEVVWCAVSVVGQCLHYHFGRRVLAHLYPHLSFAPQDLSALADHITAFSLAGLAARRRQLIPVAEEAP